MASGCYKHLTRKHGVKVCATFPCSVEDIGLAVGEKVGHGGVVSAARMNRAVVVFLDRVEKVNSVVETGITVNSCFVQVLPLCQPATKVVLSNVPPFITDEFLSRELSRHGKVASPIRRMLSGCKSPLLKHVVSHRRQLYMILNNRNEELNLRFVVKVDDYDYTIYATSAGMKCFGCGEEGHSVRACPERSEPAPPGPGAAAAADAGAPAAPPVPEQPRAPAWGGAGAAGMPLASGVPAAGVAASIVRPIAAPRRPAAVAEPTHGKWPSSSLTCFSEEIQVLIDEWTIDNVPKRRRFGFKRGLRALVKLNKTESKSHKCELFPEKEAKEFLCELEKVLQKMNSPS